MTIQKGIVSLIKEKVNEERLAVLYITHNLGIARELSGITYVMYAGTIAEQARTSELLESPLHPYTVGLIASIPTLSGREFTGIDGRIPDYISPPSGCRFHPRCRSRMDICGTDSPRLSEVEEKHLAACHLFSSGGKK